MGEQMDSLNDHYNISVREKKGCYLLYSSLRMEEFMGKKTTGHWNRSWLSFKNFLGFHHSPVHHHH